MGVVILTRHTADIANLRQATQQILVALLQRHYSLLASPALNLLPRSTAWNRI
jgi:hypothetical protein